MARSWRCARCSTTNGEGVVNCAKCGLPRDGDVVPQPPRSGTPVPNQISGAWGQSSLPPPVGSASRRRIARWLTPWDGIPLREVAIGLGGIVAVMVVAISSLPLVRTGESAASDPPPPVVSPGARSPGSSGLVNARDLLPGDCWDGPPERYADTDLAGNVRVRPCTQEHSFEVIWSGSMKDRAFPTSDNTFWAYEETFCWPAFQQYVGLSWLDSKLIIWSLHPNADAWLTGERYFVCSVSDIDANTLTASVKGSRR